MRDELRTVLFDGKKNRLANSLDWINQHCSEEEKHEVNSLLTDYSFLLSFPQHSFLRCSHSVDSIEVPPSQTDIEHDLENRPKNKVKEDLNSEIRKRKELVNGLIMEIEELEHQLNEVEKL